jgi:hypothetical protein
MQYQGGDVDVPDSLVEALEGAVNEALQEVEMRVKSLGR